MKEYLRFAFIVIIISLRFSNCYSQVSRKVELGFGVPYFPTLGWTHPILYPNLSLRIVDDKNCLRGGLSYNLYNFFFRTHHSFIINLGYERRLLNRKVKLLVGSDICYYDRFFSNTSAVIVHSSRFYNYGIGPVLGIMYSPFNNFFIRSESGFFWGPSYTEYDGISFQFAEKYSFTIHRFVSIELGYVFERKKSDKLSLK